ncbi:MAG: hypothetical protein LBV19_02950 [Streptococcaceae bacterium]|jgi:lipopolysaccharide export LptBFGC system permease protein LptF|nr:hypothetical protein [Streptococcaceae bacterium]
MSKKPRNSKQIVIIHTLGIFVLMLLWLLLIIFKDDLGNLRIPVLIAMIVMTAVGIVVLTKMVLKGVKKDD